MPFLLAWAVQQIKEILLALNDIRASIGALASNSGSGGGGNPNAPTLGGGNLVDPNGVEDGARYSTYYSEASPRLWVKLSDKGTLTGWI